MSSSKVGARNIAGFNAKVAEYNAQSEMKQVPFHVLSTSWQILMMVVQVKKWKMLLFALDRRRAAGIHYDPCDSATIG